MFDIRHLLRPLIYLLVLHQFQKEINCIVAPENLRPGVIDQYIRENGISHHTSKYAMMKRKSGAELVVRRGQEFILALQLDRNYDEQSDRIRFDFGHYGIPRSSRVVNMSTSSSPIYRKKISVTLLKKLHHAIKIKVFLPADVAIGKWKLGLRMGNFKRENFTSYSPWWHFYVILNPWCPYDNVYGGNETARQEYVMAEWGLLWRKKYDHLEKITWKYSQFDEGILDIAFYLLNEVAQVAVGDRNNPVAISHGLSVTLDSLDDNGVFGNCTDRVDLQTSYDSKDILLQYYKTKRPVKYGQCWVFAAIYTTISRALGLPCRPVTNYSGSRNSRGDLRINRNFHVWNEVWMQRTDLGDPKYNGWQAVHVTARKRSGKFGRCGPAPVYAVKHSHNQIYDTRCFFASVNANK